MATQAFVFRCIQMTSNSYGAEYYAVDDNDVDLSGGQGGLVAWVNGAPLHTTTVADMRTGWANAIRTDLNDPNVQVYFLPDDTVY